MEKIKRPSNVSTRSTVKKSKAESYQQQQNTRVEQQQNERIPTRQPVYQNQTPSPPKSHVSEPRNQQNQQINQHQQILDDQRQNSDHQKTTTSLSSMSKNYLYTFFK